MKYSPFFESLASIPVNKTDFKIEVLQWAEKLDVEVKSIAVRPMKNKWASCSTNGRLNFSNAVMELDHELRDYVVVHELLHFSVPNHGKLWKSLMLAHLGDCEVSERRLREIASSSKKESL